MEKNDDNGINVAQDTVPLKILMSRINQEIISSMTEKNQGRESGERHGLQRQRVMHAVNISLAIARAISLVCPTNSAAQLRQRKLSSSQQGKEGPKKSRESIFESESSILDAGDISVQISDQYEIFDVNIAIAGDQERKKCERCYEKSTLENTTSILATKDSVIMIQRWKLLSLGRILQELYQSVAPFPSVDTAHDDDIDDNPGPSTKLCLENREPKKKMAKTITHLDSHLLRESGVPSVLCDLVDNLLLADSNFDRSRESEQAYSIYEPYTSMQEVTIDLELIVSDPERFLFEHAFKNGNASSSGGASTSGRTHLFQDGNIYGRENHTLQLHNAFDRFLGKRKNIQGKQVGMSTSVDPITVSPDHREVVLLSGYSGSGKSSIVMQTVQERGFHEIRRTGGGAQSDNHSTTIRRSNIGTNKDVNVCFISGKFDERSNHAQPMSAIVSAFNGYCVALLKNEISGLDNVRKALRDALGTDSIVLTDLIPSLFGVINTHRGQEKMEETGSCTTSSKKENIITEGNGLEAKHRLEFLFCKFIRAIARPSHPIVLFLDDLHWADDESLDLMYALIVKEQQETRLPHFLFIGSYRDNQVTAEHPLNVYMQRIQKKGVAICNIFVGDLSVDNVNAMLSDNLQVLPRLTKPLANIIHNKTNGNALFVRTFIISLIENGFLAYSPRARRWMWDCESIRCNSVADGVAKLMITKMRKLDSAVQNALVVAACLGACSDISILQKLDVDNIFDRNKDDNRKYDLIDLLDKAVTEGLMTTVGSSLYKFPHDMIESAAYSLIPNADCMHLKIGRQLWSRCSEMEPDTYIFTMTSQLNEGSNLITDRREKLIVSALNLRAGKKCMEKAAFVPAAMYLRKGTQLLRSEDWQGHYQLCLDLYNSFVEVLCARGSWAELKDALIQVFTFSKSFDDKIPAYFVLVKSLGLQDKIPQAASSALEVLYCLGEIFPAEIDRDTVIADFHETQHLMDGFTMAGVVEADEMQDINKIAAMKFLSVLSFYLYFGSSQTLTPLVIFRMVRLSLLHGVCKESAFGFAAYGMMLANLHDKIELGYSFGKVALSLIARFDAEEYFARVHFLVFGMINIWKEPLQSCVEGLNGAYHAGISTGEVFFSSSVVSLICLQSLQCGLPLDHLIKRMRSYVRNVEESKQKLNLSLMLSYLQVALNLRDSTGDPTELTGEAMNQNTVLEAAAEGTNVTLVAMVYFLRMWLSYLFGRYDVAEEMFAQCEDLSQNNTGQRMRVGIIVNETFYGGLIALVKARETKESKWKRKACKSVKKIKIWSENAAWNCENKLKLLEAELFFLDRHIESAKKTYDESIDIARKHHFTHEEALACERAGIFHYKMGNHITAEEYFSRSHQLYLSWGAKCKAKDVVVRYLTNIK